VSSTLQRPATARLPLAHASGAEVLAYRHGKPITAAQFAAEVLALAARLPDAGHVLNFCADRYRFAVVLCAALVRGQVTLLPPTTTPNVIRAMHDFARDTYYVSDDPATVVDLPRFDLQPFTAIGPGSASLPEIAADQLAACVFTSGSTGEPQPHRKAWGGLVRNVLGEAQRLGVTPAHAVLGTVPPQHMYGLESTVLLPLATGAALTAERLFYPADIDTAIRALPAPRLMFTTPFHLRTWVESGGCAHLETLVSATAPLSVHLARTAEEMTGAMLYEIYGCTEAGQVATRRTAHEGEWEAFDGLRLSTEGDRAQVMGGHVERPTPLADIIELRGNGTRFLLHGRSADMVNIAGKRNSLGYLNHQLTSIPGVEDGVFFLPDEGEPDGAARLTALVVAPRLSEREVLAGLRSRIDAAFMPRPLLRVDALPRQLTGKLPREALLALAARAKSRKPR
jgi:acyl-coenzyme A synthetase/AMP-(fatty) acid ligase